MERRDSYLSSSTQIIRIEGFIGKKKKKKDVLQKMTLVDEG